MDTEGNKPDPTLVPPQLVEAAARAFTEGVGKYPRHDWSTRENAPHLYAKALLGHVLEWFGGSDADDDSGLHPLDHIAANVAILVWLRDQGMDVGGWRVPPWKKDG